MTLDLNCVPINGTVFRLLGPVTLAPDQRHHQIDSVCLSSVARYEIVVEYNTFTAAINWFLDSVSGSKSSRLAIEGKNHNSHKTQLAQSAFGKCSYGNIFFYSCSFSQTLVSQQSVHSIAPRVPRISVTSLSPAFLVKLQTHQISCAKMSPSLSPQNSLGRCLVGISYINSAVLLSNDKCLYQPTMLSNWDRFSMLSFPAVECRGQPKLNCSYIAMYV